VKVTDAKLEKGECVDEPLGWIPIVPFKTIAIVGRKLVVLAVERKCSNHQNKTAIERRIIIFNEYQGRAQK
jgi:hypothetical protein